MSEFNRLCLYKTRSTQIFSTTQRVEVTEKLRRESRLTLMLQKRNISAYMSPINSPRPAPKKIVTTNTNTKKNKSQERLALLQKWKEQKKKKLEKERLNAKPIFKVCHLSHSSKPDLNDVYGKIKGRTVHNKSIGVDNKQESFKFVPSSTYKFKPPKNVKPVQMTKANKTQLVKKALNFNSSRDNCDTKVETVSKSTVSRRKSLTKDPLIDKKSRNRHRKKSMTQVELKSEETPNSQKTPPTKTPEKVITPIAYISPFVTLSRGKDNARREYNQRRSNCQESPAMNGLRRNTTPEVAASFFTNLLDEQQKRLNELCEIWKTYEEEESPPEEACDMIRMAIGQTDLLLTKKFGKFTQLIEACRSRDSENSVTCIDLHGFWDNITLQIHNLDQRFENLKNLKDNNWIEILPVLPTKQKIKVKKDLRKKEVKSSLRDLIKEARKKKFDGEPSVTKSPAIELRSNRNRLSNVSNLTPKSTGNATMTTPVKHIIKDTPKSILKSGQKSVRKRTKKSVLFVDDNKENMYTSGDLIEFSPIVTRRSSRLAQKRNE